MDRFEAMIMLIEVVERGSLSAASRSLRVPLPTLSRRVTDLEARLGVKLLIRTTRSLVPTDAGTVYLAAARQIIEQVREAECTVAGELVTPKGELVVAAPVLFGRLYVLPLVTEFLALHPQIDVRLRLSDRNVHLVDDHVDLAVRIGPLADSAMISTRVGAMRTVVCASPDLLAEHGAPGAPEDLGRFPRIEMDAPSPSPGWSFASADGTSAVVDFGAKPRLSVTTAEAAAEAARRSVGVVRLLQYQATAALADGSLQIILEGHEPPLAPVHLLHVGREAMPIKLRRFLDHAAPRMRERLGALGERS